MRVPKLQLIEAMIHKTTQHCFWLSWTREEREREMVGEELKKEMNPLYIHKNSHEVTGCRLLPWFSFTVLFIPLLKLGHIRTLRGYTCTNLFQYGDNQSQIYENRKNQFRTRNLSVEFNSPMCWKAPYLLMCASKIIDIQRAQVSSTKPRWKRSTFCYSCCVVLKLME